MGDPTQHDRGSSSSEPETHEQPGDPPAGSPGIDRLTGVASASGDASTSGPGTPDGDDADLDDHADPDDADDADDPVARDEMVEHLLARIASVRQQRVTLVRERSELRRALRRVGRERDRFRAAHQRALRRAEAAELRLAEVQGRIAALEDSLQQRRRAPGGSAKLPGPGHDAGQGFK